MVKKHEIRNSTAEFLTFVAVGKEEGIQVLYKNETIWATQKAMATLFDCSTDNISLHLKNIFKTGELIEKVTTEKSSVVEFSSNSQSAKIFFKCKEMLSGVQPNNSAIPFCVSQMVSSRMTALIEIS